MSDKIADIILERAKRETSPHLQWKEEDGVTWFRFGAEYLDSENKTFIFYFYATDFDDAESRLTRIQSTARLIGRSCEEIIV